jgi:hypothetical protein
MYYHNDAYSTDLILMNKEVFMGALLTRPKALAYTLLLLLELAIFMTITRHDGYLLFSSSSAPSLLASMNPHTVSAASMTPHGMTPHGLFAGINPHIHEAASATVSTPHG